MTEERDDALDRLEVAHGLFRKAAIQARHKRLNGEVVLAQPVALRVILWLLFGMSVVSIFFLSMLQWERRQTVLGHLTHGEGLVGIYAPQAGVARDVFVALGDDVEKGTPLARIVAPDVETGGQELAAERVAALEKESRQIQRQLDAQRPMIKMLRHDVEQRRAILTERLRLTEDQIAIQRERAEKSRDFLRLAESGKPSLAELRRREETAMEDRQELLGLLDEKEQLLDRIDILSSNLRQREADLQQRISDLEVDLSETGRALMGARVAKGYMLRADSAGRIATTELVTGDYVRNDQRLFSLLPNGELLTATLFVPSRAAGFLRIGQEVQLKYDAFPFERYGFHLGEVVEITHTVINKDQVPNFLTANNAAYFTAKIALPEQVFSVDEVAIPLKAGMQLHAEIVFDRRPVMTWILNDILKITG